MGKAEAYRAVQVQLESVLEDCPDFVAAMASAAALLNDTFDHYFWTGFYLLQPDGSLRVGPYQGPLACIVLPPGKGVCGAVVKARASMVVPDVHAFPDHIACDARSRSEVVVPVWRGEELIGVLDVDAQIPSAFDQTDCSGLERVADLVTRVPW